MSDVSTLGRITSGVKLINLDKDVIVAKIAKVREKVSNGDEELTEEELDSVEEPVNEIAEGFEEEITLPKEEEEE